LVDFVKDQSESQGIDDEMLALALLAAQEAL
jgi:hypothetical protein